MADESLCFCGQHNDTVVGVSDADFVLGADHAERFHSADFRFLDFELTAVGCIERGADRSHDNNLACCDIWRAAHNLHRSLSEFDSGDVEMVAVGMFRASEHFADNDAGEAAADRFYRFDAFGFKAYGSKSGAEFFGGKIEVNVLFEPFI